MKFTEYEITNEILTEALLALKELDGVEASALGGSRASDAADDMSDYDIYIYCTEIPAAEARKNALSRFCSNAEFGNHYWENEDNLILSDGTPVDVIYRETGKLGFYFDEIVVRGRAMNGYTTAFWHNVRTCRVLFDKTGKFTQLKKRAQLDYPEVLRLAITKNNRALLSGKLPSYDMQIKKAEERGDLVSVNHRITAFLESYFDIIFALNRQTHPGEKRQVSLCKKLCKTLPRDFEKNVTALVASAATGGAYETAVKMTKLLDEVLDKERAFQCGVALK